jgi:hypothetical protein
MGIFASAGKIINVFLNLILLTIENIIILFILKFIYSLYLLLTYSFLFYIINIIKINTEHIKKSFQYPSKSLVLT